MYITLDFEYEAIISEYHVEIDLFIAFYFASLSQKELMHCRDISDRLLQGWLLGFPAGATVVFLQTLT